MAGRGRDAVVPAWMLNNRNQLSSTSTPKNSTSRAHTGISISEQSLPPTTTSNSNGMKMVPCSVTHNNITHSIILYTGITPDEIIIIIQSLFGLQCAPIGFQGKVSFQLNNCKLNYILYVSTIGWLCDSYQTCMHVTRNPFYYITCNLSPST
jgi:hypothetical protein